MSDGNKPRVMVVDDSPEDIHLLLAELKADYAVSASMSGEDAIKKLEQGKVPDLILMDVNMPGMSGYEACKNIKNKSEFSDIDIIFLSANDTTEEIMKGFDVGAIDYLVKPYDPTVLRSKLQCVLDLKKQSKDFKQEADSANELIHTFLSESGNMANIIAFLRESFAVKNPEELMQVVLRTFEQYNLHAVVYFQAASIRMSEATHRPPTMLEVELMARMCDSDQPFIEKNSRTFIIQKNVVALINDMPDDNNKRTALKDNLRILLEGVNSKLGILAELASHSGERIHKTRQSITAAKNMLNEIHILQEAHKKHSMEILDEMVREVEGSFFSMGLADYQEKKIMDILNNAINKSLDHFESGIEIDGKIKDIITDLSKVATSSAMDSQH